jgi:hypothetical protein
VSASATPSPVGAGERLARFITKHWWVRSDGSIQSDAFFPPKDLNLSVTRHLSLAEESLWILGQKVVDTISEKCPARLYGRADISADDVARQALTVEAAPLAENPNHAHITGWPDKPARKSIAQQLAKAAMFVASPQALRPTQGQ